MQNSKIKIFVDAHVFDGLPQGTTTYIKGLYNALVEDDRFEITLAAMDLERLKKNFDDPRFKYVQLPSGSKFKRLAADIPNIISNNGYHVAHFQYIVPFKKKCIYVNTIHDLLFKDLPQYFPFSYRLTKGMLFKYSARRSDLICTVSNYSKEAIKKHFGISEEQLFITPNAIERFNTDIDIKQKYRLNNYILFVSRMEPRKNHALVLRCFKELRLHEQNYHLVFVGKTKDVSTPEFEDQYRALEPNIHNKVVFIENASNEELTAFYKSASLFVYPSFGEGFGIPPLEAAVNKCKVICSNQTAMADFDFFGKYLVDPHNAEQVKQKMKEALEDTNYPFDKIKEEVERRYNWKTISEAFAQRLISVCQQAVR